MEAAERVIREAVVWAVMVWKLCSWPWPFSSRILTIPPKKKHMPITSNRFDRIEPIIDDLTTSICLSLNAIILTCRGGKIWSVQVDHARNRGLGAGPTINSTALPNVALSKPPKASPSFAEISSVANESTAANGIMAKKLMTNTATGSQPVWPAMIPIGTATRRMLTGPIEVGT